MINLNLGSGSNRKNDYISVDLYDPLADVKHDLTTPLPYDDGTVDNIYACHIIEHFTRKEWEFIRSDWSRAIKSGGRIEILCPDLSKLCRLFLDLQDPLQIERIYGHQSTPGEFHKNGFTEEILIDAFPGFTAINLPPSTEYELHMAFRKK